MLALLSGLWKWQWIDVPRGGSQSDVCLGTTRWPLYSTQIWINQPSGRAVAFDRIRSRDRALDVAFRQVKPVQSSIGPILIGRIMVFHHHRNRFYNCSVMFDTRVLLILGMVHRSSIAVLVRTSFIPLLLSFFASFPFRHWSFRHIRSCWFYFKNGNRMGSFNQRQPWNSPALLFWCFSSLHTVKIPVRFP